MAQGVAIRTSRSLQASIRELRRFLELVHTTIEHIEKIAAEINSTGANEGKPGKKENQIARVIALQHVGAGVLINVLQSVFKIIQNGIFALRYCLHTPS
jgi:hypothetical protein